MIGNPEFRARRVVPILVIALATVSATAAGPPTVSAAARQQPRFMLVVHGGAGDMRRSDLTPEQDQAYRDTLTRAIEVGYDILNGGGSALDAVQRVINVLEDSPLFNAGKGAVFTNAGTNELDASIMDGRTLNAGAVAGVKHISNPIDLARLVMERSRHVMLAGEGAEAFAKSQDMQLVDQDYFFTQRRWDQMEQAKTRENAGGSAMAAHSDDVYGTVGVVALDSEGNLAAGTSTGGLTNKRWGRIGDSPIIGAGTYANNASCAVSATGTGEFFIRNVVAHDICVRVQYLDESVEEAANYVLMDELVRQGGDGGVIVLDAQGNRAMVFNTSGMFRGQVGPDGEIVVKIYKEE